jgi:hypothetical protein
MKRKLEIDQGALAMAFEDASWERRHYLDTETGQLVWISDEASSRLERLYEEVYDPDSQEPVDLAEVLQDYDLPDWQKEELLEADRVESGYGTRYIRVPRADSHEGYRDMQDFIYTVEEESLQDRLWRAISGRGAFRYFKNVLADRYRERKRWFAFQEERLQERMEDWLEFEGIEPEWVGLPSPEPEPPGESPRARLLAEALAFVQAASRLPGVTRIALIGSLTTEEPDPKDVDLLVAVTDEMDLAPLATLGRKVQGHAQSFARGGEVFLADPRGRYLGRTCPWKRCGPGIRVSCDALHCGRRLYLHDDLEAVHLPEDLIAAPPLELWPQVVARVPVPDDVEEVLLFPLRAEQG